MTVLGEEWDDDHPLFSVFRAWGDPSGADGVAYNAFLLEQIAGDLLTSKSTE